MDICRFIHSTKPADLPHEVVRQARRCLVDVVATAIAARRTDLSQIVHNFAVACHGGRGGVLWQDGREVSPPGAALANAATVDALDIHDGHSLTKGHAGAAVVPAVMATWNAEPRLGAVSGLELLTTIAIGYEIAIRAGIALHATARDYHTSGAWNALGCAAVAARRLQLSNDQTQHSLGVAEYHGPRSPMMRCIAHPTMLKDGSGWGAMCGVSAALLAAQGFTGRPADTVEAAPEAGDWSDLGRRWEFLNLYFKPHAICRWAQPAVEGALALKAAHDFDPAEIAAIHVETFAAATQLAVRTPATTEEAQYSLPFPVAAALCCGQLGPDELIGRALHDERVVRLAQRVEMHASAKLSALFPARRLANVAVTLECGVTHRIDGAEPRWEATAPPTDEAILEKFHWLAASLPQPKRSRLANRLWHCVDLADVSTLCDELADPA